MARGDDVESLVLVTVDDLEEEILSLQHGSSYGKLDSAVVAQDRGQRHPQRMSGHSRASKKPLRTMPRPKCVDVQMESSGNQLSTSPNRGDGSPKPLQPICCKIRSPPRRGSARQGATAVQKSLSPGVKNSFKCDDSEQAPQCQKMEESGKIQQDWNLENVSPQQSLTRSPLSGSSYSPQKVRDRTSRQLRCFGGLSTNDVEEAPSQDINSDFDQLDLADVRQPIAPYLRE
jgi:hypothetical protein